MGDRAKQHRLSQSMKWRVRRWLSLTLAAAVVTGGLPSAWAQETAETTATLAQRVPEVEPWTVTGRLDENSEVFGDRYLNAYPFEGLAGQVVTINLTSHNLNTWVMLSDPNNQVVAEDISYGEGGNIRLVLTLPTTGVYAIGVTSAHLGGVGNYQLTLQPGTTADLEGATRLEEARALHAQGFELYQSGRYREAVSSLLQALSIRQEELGERHPLVANTLNSLAELYRTQGRYGEAEPLYQESLEIWREQLGDRHPNVATSLNNLAGLYQVQGRYREAEPLYQESLEIWREQLGDRHLDVATSLNNLAGLYEAQGRYVEAEPILRQALDIRREQLGDRHPDVAQTLNNLALLNEAQGRYFESEALYHQALEIYREQWGGLHPDVATSLNNLAWLYQIQGRYGEAEPLYQESLEISREQLGDRHPNVANGFNNLAGLYHDQGRYGEAESLYQESLEISREQLGDRHPNVATSLNNLAALYRDQGRYGEAEPFYQKSLEIAREQLGDRHPDVARSFNNLAVLYQAQGRIDTALTYLQQGLDVQETNLSLNLAIGSEDRKQAYMATIAGTTNYAFSLHLQDAPDNRGAAHLAFTTLLRRKGRILDALTDTQQRLRQNLSPDIALVLDDYAIAQSQLAALLYRGLGEQDPTDYRRQVDELRQTVNRLENDLSRRSAEFRVETEPVEIAAVQALLPTNSALVEIVQYRPFDATSRSDQWGAPRYAAYVLHPTGDLQWVELGDAATLDAAAFDFLNAVRNPASGTTARTTGRALDALVMEPLRPLLGDATHLLLSPDSQLNLVPFAALVDEQDQFLVESYTLTHLTTGRDLLRLQVTASSQQPPIVFANPDYDRADGAGAALVASATRGESQRSGDMASLQFGPLPGTQLEVDAIAPLLNNPLILTDADASEAALKQVQGPSILHIATHGFFLEDVEAVPPPDDTRSATIIPTFTGDGSALRPPVVSRENPLLRSGLAFAGFNTRASAGEDGVLTALEAAGLRLRGTRLVVMSACETGVGDVATGEGVYGLRRALVMAGAESQLMSLWKVDDYATAELMQLYYDRILSGEDRSESLRQVQLDLLTAPAYAHPYYWSSFLFSGDWRPLDGASQPAQL